MMTTLLSLHVIVSWLLFVLIVLGFLRALLLSRGVCQVSNVDTGFNLMLAFVLDLEILIGFLPGIREGSTPIVQQCRAMHGGLMLLAAVLLHLPGFWLLRGKTKRYPQRAMAALLGVLVMLVIGVGVATGHFCH